MGGGSLGDSILRVLHSPPSFLLVVRGGDQFEAYVSYMVATKMGRASFGPQETHDYRNYNL